MRFELKLESLPHVMQGLSESDDHTTIRDMARVIVEDFRNLEIENSNLKKTVGDRREVIAAGTDGRTVIEDVLYNVFGEEEQSIDIDSIDNGKHAVTNSLSNRTYELIIRRAGNGVYCDYAREITEETSE